MMTYYLVYHLLNKCFILIKNKKAIEINFGTFKFEKLGLSYFDIHFNKNDTISFNENKDLLEIGVLLPFYSRI